MKRVLKIFVHDLVGLSRNIFALIIAVGLCIIPSLYAWFNIYSNWDPYAKLYRRMPDIKILTEKM